MRKHADGCASTRRAISRPDPASLYAKEFDE